MKKIIKQQKVRYIFGKNKNLFLLYLPTKLENIIIHFFVSSVATMTAFLPHDHIIANIFIFAKQHHDNYLYFPDIS